MTPLADRLRRWRPRTPELPEDLAALVRADDPEWFPRRMAIAAAPPWWLWRFALGHFSWLVGRIGDADRARYRIAAAITRGLAPLRAGEEDRPHFVDHTRPTTAVAAFPGGLPRRPSPAAFPGGVVPEDVP